MCDQTRVKVQTQAHHLSKILTFKQNVSAISIVEMRDSWGIVDLIRLHNSK